MNNRTNWSSPKTNIIAGMNDLRKALASGYKSRLVREYNENCQHPIREKHADSDFRNYKHMYGTPTSVNKIMQDTSMTEVQKHLTLNYVSVFGDHEAADHYYQTGELKKKSLHTPGFNFLVHVDDLIQYYRDEKNFEAAGRLVKQYRAPEHVHDVSHWFDFYSYQHGCPYAIKKFKRRLWVVESVPEDVKVKTPFLVRLISLLVAPLKWIPTKSVLRMEHYRVVTLRIGDVIHGLSVDIHLPKKFSFN